MPISLIVFDDKKHTDLHGALAVTPIIFTLSLFNQSARNNPFVWRPIAYIPNLSHGWGKTDKTKSYTKCQDKHACLALAFRDLCELIHGPHRIHATTHQNHPTRNHQQIQVR